ncbi:hypothetical protein H0H92_002580 [Tricholoma furcatifolium]|nr:hypothetical protein H0H92_002580 [Tricholoma furcatifolium]
MLALSQDFSLCIALEKSCAGEQNDDDVLGLFSMSPLLSAALFRACSPDRTRSASSPTPAVAELLPALSSGVASPSLPPLPRPMSAAKRKRLSKVTKDEACSKK